MSPRSRYIIYACVLLIPFVVYLYLSSHLELERYQTTRSAQLTDEHSLPASSEISAAALNYDTAAADVLWLGMIFYASARRVERKPRRGVTGYAEAITDLDPYLGPVYIWHDAFRYGTTLNPTYQDLQASNRILKEGLEYFPDQWQLARSIVMNHHTAPHRLEIPPEQRLEDLREAVYYAELGADMPDAPPEMTGLAINFRNRVQRLEQGLPEYGDEIDGQIEATDEELEFLFRRYFAADSDRQRQFLRHQLLRMGAEEELLDRIGEYEGQFRRSHRQRYGYVPPDTFILVDYHLYDWTQPENL